MAQSGSSAPIRAAGGVLWRSVAGSKDDSIEIAVIHRPRYDDWSLPKGKLNAGEIEIEGAAREVLEETGYRPTIVCPLGETHYIKEGRPKTVRYWSMRSEGGMFTPGREVDELRWLSLDEARSLLTTERDREILARFSKLPITVRTLLIVRHGSAGNRSAWPHDDADRPLDDVGREQAEGLIRLLTRWDVREIYSAPLTRCRQTVEPLASAVGLPVQDQPLLSEEQYPKDPRAAERWIVGTAHEGTATVLCSQGGVIPAVLPAIVKSRRKLQREEWVAKKGSLWAITFAARAPIAVEYFPPLA